MNRETASLLPLRQVLEELPELSAIPLFGNAPPFPWESFGESLQERLGISSLEIRVASQEWKKREELRFLRKEFERDREGGLYCRLSPLASHPFFFMEDADRTKLVSQFLGEKENLAEPLKEGFFRYLLLEALEILNRESPFQDFTPTLSEEIPEEEEEGFLLRLEIRLQETTCWAVLFLSAPFCSAWRKHFSQFPRPEISIEQAAKISVSLEIRKGSFKVTPEELEQLRPGDFIPLPPSAPSVFLGKMPLFSSRIEGETLRLIDYAHTQEDSMEQEEKEEATLRDLPMQVTVEVARLKMSLGELLQLQPGNTLALSTPLERGAVLTVEGRTIGRGELVSLGDTFGIRILEMY